MLITFDVYTALFDIEGSLTPLVREMLGNERDSLGFVRAWRSKQLEYALISNSLEKERIPFESITRRSLDDTLSRRHVDVDKTIRDSLVHAWQNLNPWDEAAAVLETLKSRGYTLGLLSNGDTGLLQTLTKKLPPVIEHIFSSEQAGYYKPHPSIYKLPFQALHIKTDELLHVAGSPTDVLGAKAAGLRCAWSNRQSQPTLDTQYPADYEMTDLNGLLNILYRQTY